jgi:hypothetical protein
MKLINIGVPLVFLSGLKANILYEVYCMLISRLLAKGAIEKLPVLVHICYANPGIKKFFEDKLVILNESQP